MPELTLIEQIEEELSRRERSSLGGQIKQELSLREGRLLFREQVERELATRAPSPYQQQQQAQEEARREAELEHARRELAESYLPNIKAFAAEAGSDLIALGARLVGRGETADRYTRFGEAIEQAARERDERSWMPAILSRGVRGAARSLTTMAPAAAVAGPYAAIGLAAAQESNRAITKGKDAGLKGIELAGYVVSEGVIEAAPAAIMQKVGLGGLESVLSKKIIATGVKDGLKKLGVALAQELPEELVTEIGHNVAAYLSGVEPGAITPENLRQTIADTTVQTILAVGMAGSPSIARAAEAGVIAKKTARTTEEMETYAKENKVPSRKTWRKWGLAPKLGETRKQRRAFTKELAGQLQAATEAPEAAVTPVEPRGVPVPPVAPEGLAEPQAIPTEVQGLQIEPTAEFPPTPTVEQEVAPPAEVTSALEPAIQREAAPADPALHDMQVEMEGTGERVSAREIVRGLEEMWGVPIRAGRMGVRKARGIYKRRAQVIRLAKGEESSPAVAAHEVAHHLDRTTDILDAAPEGVGEELGALDYDQTQKRAFEGFAEFIRGYTTGSTAYNEDFDIRDAPEFTRYFEEFLSNNPEIKAKIEATKELMTQWRMAGAVGRVKGQISETGVDVTEEQPIRKRINEWKEYFYTRIKEAGRPIKRFVGAAEKHGYVPGEKETTPFEDYNALRQTGPHFAANAIEDGVFRLSDMEKIGPSLREVLSEIQEGEDRMNFTAWAYARHAVESWKRGKNPGITLADAEETVRQLQDPRYEQAANKLTKFLDATVDVLTDVGVVEEEEATKIKEYYEHYLPLRRARKGAISGGARRLVDLSSAIKGRSGSGLQIIDPLESALAITIERYERASKQIVINKLYEVAKNTKGLGGWAEEVPTKVTKTLFKAEAIKAQLRSALEEGGILEEDIDVILDAVDPATVMSIWKPDLMKVRGEPIVRVTIEGKPKFVQLHPELWESLGGLDTLQNLDMVTRVVKGFTSGLKIGATRWNPSFIITNAIRDFQTFLIQGMKGLKGAFDPATWATAYVVSEVNRVSKKKGDPVVELWRQMGGELSTYTGLDRNRLRKGVRRTIAGKPSYLATGLNITGTPEVMSRLAEFAAILHDEGWLTRAKQGETPPMPVLIRAINAAHDVTVDFRRMGPWGRYLNYYIPFFNAQVEGLDKTIRTFKDHPTRTLLRLVTQRIPLALVYWWYRHDDDDYKERPEWQDNFYTFTDREGNPINRIPKPFEWGLVDSAVERMMSALWEKDPGQVTRWFKQAIGSALPNAYPAGITPLFESMFNYDSFRQRPVVSERLQKLQPPEQYYEHTSALAKQAARFLYDHSGGKVKLSPARVDHLANGLSGGLYRKVTDPITRAITGKEWTKGDIPGFKGVTLRKDYAKSVDDFYHVKEELSKLHESNKLRKDKGEKVEPEDLDRWRRFQNVTILMTDMRSAVRTFDMKERKSTELAIIGLARAALDREPLKRYPNPIVSTKTLPDDVKKEVEKHIAQKAITISESSKTKKSRQSIKDAVTYLRALGVTGATAQRVAYTRLRAQGMKVEGARKRTNRLRIYLP